VANVHDSPGAAATHSDYVRSTTRRSRLHRKLIALRRRRRRAGRNPAASARNCETTRRRTLDKGRSVSALTLAARFWSCRDDGRGHQFVKIAYQTWNWVIGSSFTSRSPGHRVLILTRCETRVFSGFRKNAQNAIRTFEMLK